MDRSERLPPEATLWKLDPQGRALVRMHQIMSRHGLLTWLPLLLLSTGCHLAPHSSAPPVDSVPPVGGEVPRELSKVVLPTYTIEPPDILVVDALHIVPKPPYHLRTSDVISLQVRGTLPDAPIEGAYPVEPGGLVNLGLPYGTIKVSGLTTDEAKEKVQTHLNEFLQDPLVSLALLEMAGKQQIAGEHLVAPDGHITLGSYGRLPVVGLTVNEAKDRIEQFLSQYLEDPEVSVDIFGYNSKVYYVITEGAGLGDNVTRFPITGNETVLDAIAQINGLTEVSSKRIWIARPTPHSSDVQILPVDWKGITAQAATGTNYQVLPGDRIFVAQDKLVTFDTSLGKLLAPFERMMGFTLLGTGTASRLSGRVLNNFNNNNGGGGFGF